MARFVIENGEQKLIEETQEHPEGNRPRPAAEEPPKAKNKPTAAQGKGE